MDAATPLKRSSEDANLESPRVNNTRSAPKISKARACESSPHRLRHPLTNVEQAPNVSATRFAANSDQESQIVQNVFAAVLNAL
jgi:hypothetical protein